MPTNNGESEMKDGYRMRVLQWVICKVFKHSEGRILPFHFYVLKAIFFPIDFFCWTQKTLRYNYAKNSVWIDGIEYDRFLFCNGFKKGNIIEVISTEGGMLTYKLLTDEFYMEKQNEYNIRTPKH